MPDLFIEGDSRIFNLSRDSPLFGFSSFVAFGMAPPSIINLFLHVILLMSFLTREHMKYINTSLRIISVNLKHINRYKTPFLEKQLDVFFSELNSLQFTQKYLNANLISPLFLVNFLTNIILQCVLIVNLFLMKDLQWEEKMSCWWICVTQTTIAIKTALILMAWTNYLHTSTSFLLNIQNQLVDLKHVFKINQYYNYKVKLLNHLEFLANKEKNCFTVGPLGIISTQTLYEVSKQMLQ